MTISFVLNKQSFYSYFIEIVQFKDSNYNLTNLKRNGTYSKSSSKLPELTISWSTYISNVLSGLTTVMVEQLLHI